MALKPTKPALFYSPPIFGSVDEGHLIVFDRTQEKTWDERIWHRPYQFDGRTIMVWGM